MKKVEIPDTEYCKCNFTGKQKGCTCERCIFCGKYVIKEFVEDHKTLCINKEFEF